MKPEIQSLSVDVDGAVIAGIRQCVNDGRDQPKMLCLHGWLDNANSFVPLMPFLPAFDLVAIDLPGHGYSDALTAGYTQVEVMTQIRRTITALGWSECHVLGHSLGGCIAPLLAVADADCVSSLTLIEASGPTSEAADQLPERLAKALRDRLDPDRYTSRVFGKKDDAVSARLSAAKMAPASARLIIDRQLRQSEAGFRWRFDPRLRMASYQYQTEEQVLAVLAAISCPVLTVIATDSFLYPVEATEKRLSQLRQRVAVTLPGHHHLHMDTPEPVAAAINRFLDATPALGG